MSVLPSLQPYYALADAVVAETVTGLAMMPVQRVEQLTRVWWASEPKLKLRNPPPESEELILASKLKLSLH